MLPVSTSQGGVFSKPIGNFSNCNLQQDDIRNINPTVEKCERFVSMIVPSAKKQISRSVSRFYMMCWTKECQNHFDQYEKTKNADLEEQLLESLSHARTARWEETTIDNLNFIQSSRTAWNLVPKLATGTPNSAKPTNVLKLEGIAKHRY